TIPYSFHEPSLPYTYPLSLHDALPIYRFLEPLMLVRTMVNYQVHNNIHFSLLGFCNKSFYVFHCSKLWINSTIICHIISLIGARSEEHTSELQSRFDLVCRLLLETKKT